MNDLIVGGRAILLDIASTLLFLALFRLTDNLLLALAVGAALAIGQIVWRLGRGRAVDALQWVSLVTVVGGGTAALATHDARFIMIKPTIIYALIGLAMLRRGWMRRYMPERALDYVPDLVMAFGYVWAGLMLVSAALNIELALTCDLVRWAMLMSIWSIASKILLFLGQVLLMKIVGKRRGRQRRLRSVESGPSYDASSREPHAKKLGAW